MLENSVYCKFRFNFEVVSKENLPPILCYQAFLCNTNNLRTVVWFSVFQSNIKSLLITA